MKVTGFFKAAGNSVIAPDMRDDVERKFAEARPAGTRSPLALRAGRDLD